MGNLEYSLNNQKGCDEKPSNDLEKLRKLLNVTYTLTKEEKIERILLEEKNLRNNY